MSIPTHSYYGSLPAGASEPAVNQFTLLIPEEDLSRMETLLKLSHVSSESYENTYAVKSQNFGLSREWLLAAKERWEKSFDWRKREKLVNSFPNFKTSVPLPGETLSNPEKVNIHFMAMFSRKQDAIPILLLHGWPGSFFEFLPILDILRKKYPDEATFPYHVIVPSIPGFGLSDAPPLTRDFRMEDVAWMMDHLMVKVLGFPRYVAQGGDLGARVSRELGVNFKACYAVHLNCSPMAQPPGVTLDDLNEDEKRGLERQAAFFANGTAYALLFATKPSTAGFVIGSNPLASLAWIGEKMLEWSDPASFPVSPSLPYSLELMDEILANVSLYFLTGHIHTSLWFYRASPAFLKQRGLPVKQGSDYIPQPKKFGYSWFPLELSPSPISWVATTGNLIYSNKHKIGGHFAAMEVPEALLGDLEEFIVML